MLLFQCSVKEQLKQEILEQKDRQLQELCISVTRQCSGRFMLVMITWIASQSQLSNEHEDLNAIEVYENVLQRVAKQFYDSKFDIAKLSHIRKIQL